MMMFIPIYNEKHSFYEQMSPAILLMDRFLHNTIIFIVLLLLANMLSYAVRSYADS